MFQLPIEDAVPAGKWPGGEILACDLRHILRAIGSDALGWIWFVNGVLAVDEPLMATGEGADGLEDLERSGERVSGSQLLEIAERTHQVIWGEFRAYRDDGEPEPWMRMIAFDSSRYEVWCEDEETLRRVAFAFTNTTLSSTPPS